MYVKQEDKDKFIQHLTDLLSLSDDARQKRSDWQSMKALLTKAGHWKRRYEFEDNSCSIRRRLRMRAINKSRLKKLEQLREIEESYS